MIGSRPTRIIPFAHGQPRVARLPDAHLYHLPGETHFGGLAQAQAILTSILELWYRADRT